MASEDVHPPLGIIGGSSFLEGLAPLGSDVELELREVDTKRGAVMVREGAGMVCLLRHGEGRYYPPHRIRHHAHVLAMEKLGVEHVVAFASTGSLDPDIAPGDVVVPDDYLSRHPPPTFCEDEPLHIVPELDAGLRSFLLETARQAAEADPDTVGGDIRETGVYGETKEAKPWHTEIRVFRPEQRGSYAIRPPRKRLGASVLDQHGQRHQDQSPVGADLRRRVLDGNPHILRMKIQG